MEFMENIWDQIRLSWSNPVLYTAVILSVLFVVLALSAYEYLVYRLVSHRAFYNKSFNISLSVIPLFIATIILCLQSNIVITLGTIGALAILRFRTAIKDPVDMMYLFWSVHIGITCGCQLYEVAVLTSVVVTIVLLMMEHVGLGGKPYFLVFHCDDKLEKKALESIQSAAKRYRIKSRNYTEKGIDFVVELSVKETARMTEALKETGIEKFSVIQYDSDDIM